MTQPVLDPRASAFAALVQLSSILNDALNKGAEFQVRSEMMDLNGGVMFCVRVKALPDSGPTYKPCGVL